MGNTPEDADPIPQTCGIDWLPDDVVLSDVLARLEGARQLSSVACTSRRLNSLVADQLWAALLLGRSGGQRLAALVDAASPAPAWWAGRSWRERVAALAAGQSFEAQVFNREQENEAEDFLLSSYDATCCLSPAGARALLTGDASQPLAFTARYLPMGSMRAVEEGDVPAERLRLPPAGSRPFEVFGGAAPPAGLCAGEEVEVQWKGRRSHPFGWWFGTVQAVRGNRIALLFRQYPRSSVWHRVKAPIKPGREAVVNGDCSFGYVGGLRRLTAEEREEWRRHGAPHPPAPDQLAAALYAAAAEGEGEWSDDEAADLDIDAELAAELEDELEDDELAPPVDAPAAGGAAAGAAGQDGGEAAEAAADEEAAHAPGGPPGQPIALQLGQAAGGAGQPVALAGTAAAAPQAAPAEGRA